MMSSFQVEGTELGEFFVKGDRMLPLAMETEGMAFTFGDQRGKQMKENIASGRRSNNQICGSKNILRSCGLENISCYNTNDGPTASELNFDAPALPTVSSACGKEYVGGQEHDPWATEVMEEDLIDNSKLNLLSDCVMEHHHSGVMLCDEDSLSADKSCSFSTSRMAELDSEPELFGRVHEDKESDGLLDFDWDTFEDIDFDTMFR